LSKRIILIDKDFAKATEIPRLFFYQINKTQTVKFTIEAIERRVIDPAADTRLTNNPFISRGDISTIPDGILATNENRLKIEEIGRASVAAEQNARFNSPAAAHTRQLKTAIFSV
jgi:hypothetical protein